MNARHFTDASHTEHTVASASTSYTTESTQSQNASVAMPAEQYSFKRYELKYLITPGQREKLNRLIAENLIPDEHGRSRVTSIYYDTPSYLLMRRSIEGGVYKEKLRVRAYGEFTPKTPVFVEIKKKCEGVVYKRRISTTPEQAAQALACGTGFGMDQIAHEIEGFVARYHGIEPAILISCERCAYHTVSESGVVLGGGSDAAGELRLTLDENIRWIDREDGHVWFDRSGQGRELIPQGYALMEAKCAGALPLWLVDFLSAENIRSQSFSKCGCAYRARMGERCAVRSAQPARDHTVQPVAVPVRQPATRPVARPAMQNPMYQPTVLPNQSVLNPQAALSTHVLRTTNPRNISKRLAQKGSVAYV